MTMKIRQPANISERLYIALKLNVECMRFSERMRKIQAGNMNRTSGTVLSDLKRDVNLAEINNIESMGIMTELIEEYMAEVIKNEPQAKG